MNAAREGQGGLIALSVEEAQLLIDALTLTSYSDAEEDLLARIVEWRSRHVPAGAVDDD